MSNKYDDGDSIVPIIDGRIVDPPNICGIMSAETYQSYKRRGILGFDGFMKLYASLERAVNAIPPFISDRLVIADIVRARLAEENPNMVFPKGVFSGPLGNGRRSKHLLAVPELDLSIYPTYKLTVPVRWLESVRKYFGVGLSLHMIDSTMFYVLLAGADKPGWLDEVEHISTNSIEDYMEYCNEQYRKIK